MNKMKAGIDKMTGNFSVTVYGTFILLNKIPTSNNDFYCFKSYYVMSNP